MKLNEFYKISDLVKDLWPNWKSTENAARVWYEKLKDFDYEQTKTAVEEFFASQEETDYKPLLGKILKIISKTKKVKPVIKTQPHLAYRILCIEHENPNYPKRFSHSFYTKYPVRSDDCYPEAEEKREQIQNIYGGRWIIINPTKEERELESSEFCWGRYYITCTAGVKKGYIRRTAITKDLAGIEEEELKEANALMEFFRKKYGGTWRKVDKGIFASRIPQADQPAAAILGPQMKSVNEELNIQKT